MPETKPTQSCDDNHYRISNLDLTFGTPISENAGFLLVTEMPGALQRDKSTIRSQLDLQFDSKYDGKKISRTDLENSASNDDELSEEDYEFDNEMQSMEESENEYAMAESENEYSAELGMDDNASDDENQGDGTLDIIAQLAKQDEDNENMLQNIQASTKKDTEKGAQVRNQVVTLTLT